MSDALKFLMGFLRHPLAVGAVTPSSRWLATRIVEDMALAQAGWVVELGPGTGAFTGAILESLGPGTCYLGLELNAHFAADLAAKYPGVHIINDSAERLPEHLERLGAEHADSIICGLPWASFPDGLQDRILLSVLEALPQGGRFATFAYAHAACLPTARRFRRLLAESFREVQRTPVVWRNFPPALIYRCAK